VIGAGSATVGVTTRAGFFDEENDTGSISAGTLTLDAGSSQSLSFGASEIVPGDADSAYTDLRPTGSLTGDLTVSVTDVTTTAGKNGSEDLDEQLELELWLDQGTDDDGTYDSNDVGLKASGSDGSPVFETVSNYSNTRWSNVITGMSNDWTFHVDWRLPDEEGVNAVQGDQLEITFQFALRQQQ
jgi:hypothetical protein